MISYHEKHRLNERGKLAVFSAIGAMAGFLVGYIYLFIGNLRGIKIP